MIGKRQFLIECTIKTLSPTAGLSADSTVCAVSHVCSVWTRIYEDNWVPLEHASSNVILHRCHKMMLGSLAMLRESGSGSVPPATGPAAGLMPVMLLCCSPGISFTILRLCCEILQLQTFLWWHTWMCHSGGPKLCNLNGLQVLSHVSISDKDTRKKAELHTKERRESNCLSPFPFPFWGGCLVVAFLVHLLSLICR